MCPLRVFNKELAEGKMTAFPMYDTQIFVTFGLAYLEDRLSDELRKIVHIIKSEIDHLLAIGVILSENPSGRRSKSRFRKQSRVRGRVERLRAVKK